MLGFKPQVAPHFPQNARVPTKRRFAGMNSNFFLAGKLEFDHIYCLFACWIFALKFLISFIGVYCARE
jgi:hypothetical protein